VRSYGYRGRVRRRTVEFDELRAGFMDSQAQVAGSTGQGRVSCDWWVGPWLLQRGKGQRKQVAEGRERPAGARARGFTGRDAG